MTPNDLVVRFFHDVDRRDWGRLLSALADTVEVDYTSLFGGSAERVSAVELLDRWQALLPGFDVTQHLPGPLAPSAGATGGAERQHLECNVRAYHRLVGADGGSEWIVAGRYDIVVSGSGATAQIAGITLHTSYQDGNLELPSLASARAAAAG